MMALLLILHAKLYESSTPKVMLIYKQLKFRMKLEYEAWSRSISLASLVQYAILKTLQQKLSKSSYKLKELVNDPKYNR